MSKIRNPVIRLPTIHRQQVSIRTLLLLTACIAAWTIMYLNRRQLASVEERIKAARPLAHELVVRNPALVAVVKLEEHMYDEQVWDVYVPTDSLAVYLATRNIPPSEVGLGDALKATASSSPLSAGRHRIALTYLLEGETWVTRVDIDGKIKLVVREHKQWNPQRGSTGGGSYATQANLAPEKPIVLFRRRFTSGSTPQVPISSDGLILWIE